MAKSKIAFVCSDCGANYSKWQGKCDSCGVWDSLIEERIEAPISGTKGSSTHKIRTKDILFASLDNGGVEPAARFSSGLEEFDRVLGDGYVPGSVLLLGGEPGIGKSTLVLQSAAHVAKSGARVVYITGEEAVDQVRMRAQRLGVEDSAIELASETSVDDILGTLKTQDPPRLLLIDSIQTMWTSAVETAPGTVTQVRASVHMLINYAKKNQVTLVLIGHVTKDGQIAGPRVVEHMVDAVLYFESDQGQGVRILRSFKNRFGATDEIGLLEMMSSGFQNVTNPSGLFLGERDPSVSGASVYAGMQGSRPVLIEIQALVAQTSFGTPRRSSVGWDNNRLNMLLAVLESRCHMQFGQYDVYLNVAGGAKIADPGADFAVAAALISARSDQPLPVDEIFCGEVALSGLLRPVRQITHLLKEADKLGFRSAQLAESQKLDARTGSQPYIKVNHSKTLRDYLTG